MSPRLFNVTLPWAWDGDASDEEGTYSSSALADDEAAAVRAVAEEMADSGEKNFDEDERDQYIQSRCDGWCDVYPVEEQLKQDLRALFGAELFPLGSPAGEIDLKELGRVLTAYRDLIVRPV